MNLKNNFKKLIEDIEKCEFECEAGNLKGCLAWQQLKKLLNKTEQNKED